MEYGLRRAEGAGTRLWGRVRTGMNCLTQALEFARWGNVPHSPAMRPLSIVSAGANPIGRTGRRHFRPGRVRAPWLSTHSSRRQDLAIQGADSGSFFPPQPSRGHIASCRDETRAAMASGRINAASTRPGSAGLFSLLAGGRRARHTSPASYRTHPSVPASGSDARCGLGARSRRNWAGTRSEH